MSEQRHTGAEQEKKSSPIFCVVTSDKMSKSRVAEIERFVKHPRYGKYIKRRTRLMFHDEQNVSKVGDSVLVIPARPRSARKRFDLLKVVQTASEE